jgi:pimeloyl-ACP methyl ester carboxylesterase
VTFGVRLSVAVLLASVLTNCSSGPPDAAETVVLVHGLGRTPASMLLLQERLADAGYRVVNFGYPSRTEPLEALTDSLRSAVDHCCPGPEGDVHFVTHSMGGVLVRILLAEQAEPFEGRVVMLSPPNQGSEIVDAFSDSPLLRSVLGPAGLRLGTDSTGVASELPPVNFSLGIITGDRSLNPIGSWLIPGPDDGKVGVDNARVEGADAFLVVPATHTFIMNRSDVAEQVVHFLRHGTFADRSSDG